VSDCKDGGKIIEKKLNLLLHLKNFMLILKESKAIFLDLLFS